MNFIQINVFLNVSETLNLSKTAKNLHMTQPAVTKNIQQLESELAIKLFNRGKKGVSLTKEGLYFYQHMSDIMSNIEQLIVQIKGHNFLSSIRLGYTNTPFEELFLPKILEQVSTREPNLKIVLKNFNLNAGIDDIISHRFDLILTTSENVAGNPAIIFDPLFDSKFVALVTKSSALANRSHLDINDLNDTDIILFNPRQSPPAIDRLQRELSIHIKKGRETIADTVAILITLIKGKQGVGILPSFVVDRTDSEIIAIPLDYSTKITYGIAYLTDNDHEELRCLLDIIKEIVSSGTILI
ncbi:hypothetical protein WOSG25_160290 [Weissella oryzae SG25]|uniref:HTH lysR-type domain-containing protein n=1 Tax=Weissella oryzae (strain DSM 25784 / JCM 18191 / LMG 30913 / SG25) TaxID=1329250 RepID=A0A069CWK1_WEIOS|nr:LysR family transcriptional regulator [Weissella oryzae]GAK31814.1 hypothetical protein WOSG25_160290 [Weissella oryzae SG25]